MKPLNEDGNLQVYVCTVCMHKKEPQKPPEHASEHVKLQNFLGACPQTPLAQSILWAPLFVFALMIMLIVRSWGVHQTPIPFSTFAVI